MEKQGSASFKMSYNTHRAVNPCEETRASVSLRMFYFCHMAASDGCLKILQFIFKQRKSHRKKKQKAEDEGSCSAAPRKRLHLLFSFTVEV